MRMLLLSGAGALQIGHASFACPPLSTPLRSAKPSLPPPRLVVAASILAAISLAVCFLGFAFPVMLFFFLFLCFFDAHKTKTPNTTTQCLSRALVSRNNSGVCPGHEDPRVRESGLGSSRKRTKKEEASSSSSSSSWCSVTRRHTSFPSPLLHCGRQAGKQARSRERRESD